MVKIGYSLSSEEFAPADLVRRAKLAQEAGFEFALISDHFHAWTNSQPTARLCGACWAHCRIRLSGCRLEPV